MLKVPSGQIAKVKEGFPQSSPPVDLPDAQKANLGKPDSGQRSSPRQECS